MVRRALLALALPLLLGSCAPLGSVLTALDTGTPAPKRAGALFVGQIWTLTGQIESQTVSTSLTVADLVAVPDGMATSSQREQLEALGQPRAGFQVATYSASPQRLSFRWVGEASTVYTCQIDNLLGAELRGRELRGTLSLQRPNGRAVQGTCQATANEP